MCQIIELVRKVGASVSTTRLRFGGTAEGRSQDFLENGPRQGPEPAYLENLFSPRISASGVLLR